MLEADPKLYLSIVEILKKEASEGTSKKVASSTKAFVWLTRSVQILRDKKELADTQKEIAKLHLAQKDSSSSHNSQRNEERSLTPDAKKNDGSADSTGQQLALALPSQVAPPPPPAAPQQQMVQPLSQPQGYYLPPGQYPPSQVPPPPPQQQQQQQPPPSQYMQSQVPPPQPQQQPPPQVHSLPQYQHQWGKQVQPQPSMQPGSRPSSPQVYPQYLPSQPPESLPNSVYGPKKCRDRDKQRMWVCDHELT